MVCAVTFSHGFDVVGRLLAFVFDGEKLLIMLTEKQPTALQVRRHALLDDQLMMTIKS